MPWRASVTETREVSWLTIDPVSGPAGPGIITITIEPNTGEESRTAIITIEAGSEKVAITVTQTGTGGQTSPTPDPVDPENLLTQVDYDYVWQEPAGSGTEASTEYRRGFFRVEYDELNRTAFFGKYEFDGETDKLSYYNEKTYDHSQKNRIVENEKYFQLSAKSSTRPYVIAYRGNDEESSYELDDAGRLTELIVKWKGEEDFRCHYTYNSDGTLAQYSCYQHGNLETISYEWTDGNIAAVTEAGSGYSYREEYTYTEYPNIWYGIDLMSDMDGASADNVNLAQALGIQGTRSKNLIATKTDDSGDTDTYEYTFDEKGRVATVTITSRETRNDGAIAIGTTVCTYRYGATPKPTYEEATHLTKQEIVEEGTSDYSENGAVSNLIYNSYIKIRSYFSDNTTKEDEVTQTVRMNPSGSDFIESQTIPAGVTITATAPNSVTLEQIAPEYGDNPAYRYTLHYTYFDIPTTWETEAPVYQLYTGYETQYQGHPMPTRAITEETFFYETPEITAYDEYYYFQQNIGVKIGPNAPSYTRTVFCNLIPAKE